MPSKHGTESALNKKANRKAFRRQQRKLKKKSKKLAKEFVKLEREKRLKINVENNKNDSIIIHSTKKKNKKNKKRNNKKSNIFADDRMNKINSQKEDIWIDEREEKWIKSLEKRLGFNRNRNKNENNKYWKKQEFTQDGLDCFYDLTYFSAESDVDDDEKEEYKQYYDFKQFIERKKEENNNYDINAYKEYQEKQLKDKKKEKEKQLKEEMNDNDNDNDISMNAFLEESDDDNNKNDNVSHKYLPPQLRKLQFQQNDDNIQLKRCIGGHLNRLLSHNLVTVCNLINDYYLDRNSKYSRKEITETLCQCIYNMIDKEDGTTALHSIILCLSALIASIYYSNDILIGSNIIEIISNYFNNYKSNINNKSFIYNLIRLISYLYLFEMISAKYLIEILIQFVKQCNISNFNVLTIPMLICGVDLRNNDPIKFKDLIILICNKSKYLINNNKNSKNMTKYSIDIENTMKIIFDIKDNKISSNTKNITKNNNNYKRLESSVNAIKLKSSSLIKSDMRMPMSYTDFINISKNGRWWLPGAPVKGNRNNKIININLDVRPKPIWKSTDSAYSFPTELLKMSIKFHMNTPLRKAIFCIVMDSDDYIDAFTKLMQLNINNGQHTEIIRIILLLSIRQTIYNQYYCLLIGKIIKNKKGWKFSLHCALWDKFNEIHQMITNDIINMAKFVADCINLHYLNLIVLKKLDFMKTTPKNMLFVNTLFINLLNDKNENNINNIFGGLREKTKLKELRQDIQLFFNMIMIPRAKKQIIDLKNKQKIKQEMFKKNKINKNELINIGLQLRKKENFVILSKNALNSMQKYQIKTSSYNHLIS